MTSVVHESALEAKKKIYFASDFHLGAPSYQASRERENKIVRWLDSIKKDASEIYLMGDTFDFWFEYTQVIPKGFIRLQGKLAQLSDAGIRISLFKGNHDMWLFDYFEQELGLHIISDELILERGEKKFYLHHGDGMGPGDTQYKILKRFFRSSFCQFLFTCIHPDCGMKIAQACSKYSRMRRNEKKEEFLGEDVEWLILYSKELLAKQHFDYLIFGHRHLALDIPLNAGNSRYINLGAWFSHAPYAVFDGSDLTLKYFEDASEGQ